MKSKRIEQLTITRFIAALAVVFFHYAQQLYPFNSQHLKIFVQNGNLAVSYFFVLSGFVLYLSHATHQTSFYEFILRRLSRIYPGFFIAALLGLLYFSFSENTTSTGVFLQHLSLSQAWIPGKALVFNSPAWSLSVEFTFYLLFPLVFWLNHRLSMGWSIALNGILLLTVFLISNSLYFSSYYTGFPSKSHDFLFYNPIFHLPTFSLGLLSARIYLKLNSIPYPTLILALLILLTAILIYVDLPIFWHNSGLALFFAAIILCLSFAKGKWVEFLKRPLFVFLGAISYSVYIFQEPIFHLMHGLNSKVFGLNDSVLFFVSLTVLIAVSSLVYLTIERLVHQKVSSYFS